MALDPETVKLIMEQNARLETSFLTAMNDVKKDLKENIQATGSLNRLRIIGEVEEKDEEVRKTIECVKEEVVDKVKQVEKETWLVRLMHRNPLYSAVIVFGLLIGAAFLATKIDLRPTIEKILPVVIKNELNEME